jgi:hypothetical protein
LNESVICRCSRRIREQESAIPHAPLVQRSCIWEQSVAVPICLPARASLCRAGDIRSTTRWSQAREQREHLPDGASLAPCRQADNDIGTLVTKGVGTVIIHRRDRWCGRVDIPWSRSKRRTEPADDRLADTHNDRAEAASRAKISGGVNGLIATRLRTSTSGSSASIASVLGGTDGC